PRPMNCWMLYRDEKHRELKAKNPNLTVQQISTICSEGWRKLSAAEKDHYRSQAKLAKELHQREFPNYKYTPR
ncbi:mating type protein 2, partial [Aaosphaeria arxii CBS 175.79]